MQGYAINLRHETVPRIFEKLCFFIALCQQEDIR